VKDRLIDGVLLIGLVVAAGAIVWTLFSLGGGSTPSPSSSAPPSSVTREGVDAAPSGIVPLAPDAATRLVEVPAGVPADAAGSMGSVDAGTGPADAMDAGLADTGSADSRSGDASPRIVAVAPTEPGGTGQDDSPSGASGDGATNAAGEDAPLVTLDATARDGSEDTNGGAGETPAAAAPPVPSSGPVRLERVGFSFATGGSGACGIELEAWRHVAVSRELLAAYGCGAEVTLTFDEPVAERTSVTLIVGDTMNESWSRTVNVYVAPDEPALSYGLATGSLTLSTP